MNPKTVKEIFKRFSRQFLGQTGTIEGGDGTPVELCTMGSSNNCFGDHAASFGCTPGEIAILVEWIPSGLEHDLSEADEWPKEAGINPAAIPPSETWVVFPLEFEMLKVYYKRGAQAFAL